MECDKLEKVEELWALFDKLSDKQKVEWLLEFEVIYEQVKEWNINLLQTELDRLKEKDNKECD